MRNKHTASKSAVLISFALDIWALFFSNDMEDIENWSLLDNTCRIIVGAIFEQGGTQLEATKFLLIWLLYDPNGQDPKGF